MKKEQYAYHLISFLISPLLALILAIRNFGSRYSKSIIVIFFGIYGATMIFPEGTDGSRHAANIANHYVGLSLSEFLEEAKAILLFRPEFETNDDIFLHLISYLASFFSSTSLGLYMVVGLIYGYFFITAMEKVVNCIQGKWNIILFILFMLFVSWKSLEGISSIRNHTGAWIFFNGAFSYFQTKNRKYLLLVLLAPFVHFAYFIITLPFYAIVFFGNWPKLYLSILAISFFVSLDIAIIEPYLTSTELGQAKVDAYVKDESYFQERDELVTGRKSFHVAYYVKAIKVFLEVALIYALVFMGYLKGGLRQNPFLSSLASLAILLLIASNLSSFSSSLEKRLFQNFGLYAIAFLLIFYNSQRAKNRRKVSLQIFNSIIVLGIPAVALFMFTQYSIIGGYTDMRIFVSPLFYPLAGGEILSIKEFLRTIFT